MLRVAFANAPSVHIPHARGIGNAQICCGATPGSLQDRFLASDYWRWREAAGWRLVRRSRPLTTISARHSKVLNLWSLSVSHWNLAAKSGHLAQEQPLCNVEL